MTILAWMGATVIAYLAQFNDDEWAQVVRGLTCPHCDHALGRHSVRSRAAWTHFFRRAKERIPILRLYCSHCLATYTLLPDFLTPYHRYQTPVREAVVVEEESVPPCCAQTSARWRRAVRMTLPRAIHHVICWLLTETRHLSRQDHRLLTGAVRGLEGLRQLRLLAEQAGRSALASGLFGWVNREFGLDIAFVL